MKKFWELYGEETLLELIEKTRKQIQEHKHWIESLENDRVYSNFEAYDKAGIAYMITDDVKELRREIKEWHLVGRFKNLEYEKQELKNAQIYLSRLESIL